MAKTFEEIFAEVFGRGKVKHPNWKQLDNAVCYLCGNDWWIVKCEVGHEDCISVECIGCDTWESTCYGGEE
jgi:hypothetical protein